MSVSRPWPFCNHPALFSNGRLGILADLIKLPFEQITDIEPIVSCVFFTDESSNNDQREFKLAEAKLPS